MNRFILTILALLAGLVSQAAPAQARFAAGSGAEVTVQLRGGEEVSVPAPRSGCKPQIARIWRTGPSPCTLPQRTDRPNTVEIGSDRSHQ